MHALERQGAQNFYTLTRVIGSDQVAAYQREARRQKGVCFTIAQAGELFDASRNGTVNSVTSPTINRGGAEELLPEGKTAVAIIINPENIGPFYRRLQMHLAPNL